MVCGKGENGEGRERGQGERSEAWSREPYPPSGRLVLVWNEAREGVMLGRYRRHQEDDPGFQITPEALFSFNRVLFLFSFSVFYSLVQILVSIC